MKPLNVAISMALLALPLSAVAQDNKPNTTTTVLTQPSSVAQDSPLVRAAKASGRLGKKPSIVITNDTLAKTGGHISTTYAQNALPPAPPASDVAAAAAQADALTKAKMEADAKAKRDAAAKKQKQLQNAAADYYGESVEPRVDDPAAQEHAMSQMTSTQPKTATPSKPPL